MKPLLTLIASVFVLLTSLPVSANQTIPPQNYGPPYFYPANPKDRLYKLPWDASKTYMTNGGYASDPNPMGGYLHPDYSVDFDLAEGDPVLCARAGRVYSFTTADTGCNSGTDGGNVIWISHLDSLPDSTKAGGWKYTTTKDKYLHIQPRIPVKIGDNVQQGQVIAYCSCTGTGYPHVHFRVGVVGHAGYWDTDPSYTFESVPTPFVEILNRPNGLPEKGDWYVSQNTRVTRAEDAPATMATGHLEITISPNPVARTATISVSGPQTGAATLGVYDLQGRCVKDLTPALRHAAGKDFAWNASRLPCGVYIARVKAGPREFSKRFMINK
jgi:murein DD-endopeptidase MepM/ murein hydrolase activator NlpD